jgi:hypothetical protein
VIGFTNSLHCDSGDIILKRKAEALICRLERFEMMAEDCVMSVSRRKMKYYRSIIERFGLSVPTTCAYQWIKRSSAVPDDGFFCYFILHSFGYAVRIIDGLGHQFFGGNFVHMTCICLMLINGRVFFLSPNGDYCLFAWGDGGNKEDAQPIQVVDPGYVGDDDISNADDNESGEWV